MLLTRRYADSVDRRSSGGYYGVPDDSRGVSEGVLHDPSGLLFIHFNRQID